MRFLVAGLVLIVVGIGLTEYTRRHPSEDKKAGVEKAKKVKNAPTAPPTMTALIESRRSRRLPTLPRLPTASTSRRCSPRRETRRRALRRCCAAR
jgi:hypothetical protein